MENFAQTPVTNDHAKRVRLKDLAIRFPQVFGKGQNKPLKVGITQDLLDVFAGSSTLKDFLRVLSFHTRRPEYLLAIVRGGPRFDLAGRPVGEVTEDEKQHARNILDASKRKHLDYNYRAALLKAIQGSGLSPLAYGEREGVDPVKLQSTYQKALHEQQIRRAERLALVRSYRSSGLSLEEFSEKCGRSVGSIQRVMVKVETYPDNLVATLSSKCDLVVKTE